MLSDQDRLLLDFEGSRWKSRAAKAAAIWNSFGWTESRYQRALLRLIDNPEAEAFKPSVIRKLRAMRDRLTIERRPLPHH